MPYLLANSKQKPTHAHAASKAHCHNVGLDMAHSIMQRQAWNHLQYSFRLVRNKSRLLRIGIHKCQCQPLMGALLSRMIFGAEI